MAQVQQTTREKQKTIKRNGLIVECFFGGNGKLERKIERYDRQFTEYTYQYDAKGHLAKVRRDGSVTEHYQYNQRGQRIEQQREYRGFSDSTGGMLHYDEAGRLVRAGDTSFYYDNRGALCERCDCQGITKYFYGKDTMLDKVILPSRAEIRYEYDKSNPAVPARRFRNSTLTAEFAWDKSLRLTAYRDHDNLLEYTFAYDTSGILSKVRIDSFKPQKQKNGPGTNWAAASSDWLGSMVAQNRREGLHDFLGKRSLPFELLCGCDQVGTVKILTDRSGRIVKEVVRDSFGVQCGDSFADLFIPIGFAGGLTDPDTGLVRFGYRDYDPTVGRFTALDPAKDRRGDGDIYDYCVDDPVNNVDPDGLKTRAATPEISFAEALYQSVGNVIPSGEQFIGDLASAVTSPIQTLKGLSGIVAGYSCKALGIESEYTQVADNVSEYFEGRYGSWSNFKQTLADDPVGLAGDISIFFTGGGSLAAKGASLSSRLVKGGGMASRVAGTTLGAVEKAGKTATAIGNAVDPLNIPGKIVGGAAKAVVPEYARNIANKVATPVTRAKGVLKATASASGTQQAVEREQEEKKKKEQ